MITRSGISVAFIVVLIAVAFASAQETPLPGTVRGIVLDKDFDLPLGGAEIVIVETKQKATTTDQGNFSISPVAPGKYTLTFSKDGFLRQVKGDVVVVSGQLTDIEMALPGEIAELDEFVAEDTLTFGSGSEAGLLQLRLESPALLDSIGADFISRAGVSDAASALRLVSGASTSDGKSAVIRGLPDRYVSSQLNGVRLPTADEDKRAVELDQFPAAVIEAIQVSKTFTPDQQGDASGGAVNVRLKGIPDDPFFIQFKSQVSFNSQVVGEDNFLSYDGGGVNFFGIDDGDRDPQTDLIGQDWMGAVGVSPTDAPFDSKWSMATGGNYELADDLKIGGFGSLFYERDSSFFSKGQDNSLWVTAPGAPLTPQTFQGVPPPNGEDFRTGLFDITQGKKSVQWGGLATVGVEYEKQELSLTYLYTRTAEDSATLAEDTRGKKFFYPGYDPNDPNSPGYAQPLAAPYLRLETLNYTERTTDTIQLAGRHPIPIDDVVVFEDVLTMKAPEIDWVAAFSSASLDQPDKRQFGSLWTPEQVIIPGVFSIPATHTEYKPAANFNVGNLQRIFKEITEESEQYQVNLKLPFVNWTGKDGYVKTGFFTDHVERKFNQDTFSNAQDTDNFFNAPFEEFWSRSFPFQNDDPNGPDHPILESDMDVDYRGEIDIQAWYAMMSLPIFETVKLIGGARIESTDIGIINDAEPMATWYPPDSGQITQLNPGDADVAFAQEDLLPSIGIEWQPIEEIIVRAAYNETVARQTFKELTPILQQEFAGGPVFIGNPELGMSAVKNYDVRIDWTPYQGGLVSASWFKKDIKDPIEYVQRISNFNYTTAVNYPEGTLSGLEFEVRQDLGFFVDEFKGLSIGANATFIDSEVTLPEDEAAAFLQPNINVPMSKRDMTNAPEHLYNFYLTYDLEEMGTQFSLFYTITGDTLLVGAAEDNGNFIPNVYAEEYGTLNLSISQKLFEYFKLQFQAKNLTNPKIKTIYRSDGLGDVLRTSFTEGMEFSLSLSAEIKF